MPYGTLASDVLQSSTAGTPPQFNDGNGTQVGTLCRAWMNYKGTATRAINGSFNVSSVTYNSTGNYTINFTNAMPDANYSVALSYSSTNNGGWQVMCFAESYTTSNFNVNSIGTATAYTSAADKSIVSISVFR